MGADGGAGHRLHRARASAARSAAWRGFLRGATRSVGVWAVEPAECAILAGGSWGLHRIEGIGDGFVPDALDLDLVDGVVATISDEALAVARRLARGGGAVRRHLLRLQRRGRAQGPRRPSGLVAVVTTLLCDNGLRYLSTELCTAAKPGLPSPDRSHELSAADRARLARVSLEVIR